jgi:hypothetical protein
MPAKKGNKSMKKRGGTGISVGSVFTNLFKGGAGVAENAINVFGGIGQQHAAAANDNTIAMKQMGGRRKKGGSMFVDLGAPLVLTGLNHYAKRRSGKKVGGKCSLKGGKSKKMTKKSKWGGKRKSMKKRGGAIIGSTDIIGSTEEEEVPTIQCNDGKKAVCK